MNNLYKKLNKESDHIRLTADEKRTMRAALFGAPAPAQSPVRVTRSPYVFFASHRFLTALAALVLVIFAGGSTAAYAAQSALPGQPLYALKTKVLEPVAVAFAPTAAAKAAVHVAIAQKRVEEAEALAQQGALTATTSAELAANFESNAQSAETIATQIASSDPAVAVQIHAQLSVSSAVGDAVLSAIGNESGNAQDKEQTHVLALQVGARGNRHDNATTTSVAVATPEPHVRAMAFAMATATATEATSTGEPTEAQTASINSAQQDTAAQLEQKAQDALAAAQADFANASSTLDASTTVAIQTSLAGIEAVIGNGSTALGDSLFDSAVKDFTQALSGALRLQGLLKAQQTFDHQTIEPLFKIDLHGHNKNDN